MLDDKAQNGSRISNVLRIGTELSRRARRKIRPRKEKGPRGERVAPSGPIQAGRKEIGGKRERRLYPIAFTATSDRPGTREVQPAEVSGSLCISLLALTRWFLVPSGDQSSAAASLRGLKAR